MDIQTREIRLENGNRIGVGDYGDKVFIYFYNNETKKELYFTLSQEAGQALMQLLINKFN